MNLAPIVAFLIFVAALWMVLRRLDAIMKLLEDLNETARQKHAPPHDSAPPTTPPHAGQHADPDIAEYLKRKGGAQQ